MVDVDGSWKLVDGPSLGSAEQVANGFFFSPDGGAGVALFGRPRVQDRRYRLAGLARAAHPREDLPRPILRNDVLSMDDLAPGLQLDGTVRNVVDFGAFVDIGVKQDGLLHRSQIPHGTVLSVGDVIDLEILNVDKERGRIGLGLSRNWYSQPGCTRSPSRIKGGGSRLRASSSPLTTAGRSALR